MKIFFALLLLFFPLLTSAATETSVVENSVTDIPEFIICEENQEQDDVDWCKWDLAIELGDINVCDSIINKTYLYYCYTDIAVTLNQGKVCGNIPLGEYRDNCNKKVAEATKDSAPCEYVQDEAVKNQCLVLSGAIEVDVGEEETFDEVVDPELNENDLIDFVSDDDFWENNVIQILGIVVGTIIFVIILVVILSRRKKYDV